jgi:hypothetical protein
MVSEPSPKPAVSYHRGWCDGFDGKPYNPPAFFNARIAYERGFRAGVVARHGAKAWCE